MGYQQFLCRGAPAVTNICLTGLKVLPMSYNIKIARVACRATVKTVLGYYPGDEDLALFCRWIHEPETSAVRTAIEVSLLVRDTHKIA